MSPNRQPSGNWGDKVKIGATVASVLLSLGVLGLVHRVVAAPEKIEGHEARLKKLEGQMEDVSVSCRLINQKLDLIKEDIETHHRHP